MISANRMAHQFSVAHLIVSMARELDRYSESDLQDLFLMGYVHDIGYEFAEDPDDHAAIGGEILKRAGFVYWQEVSCHGRPNCDYSSLELDLLNAADMHTSPTGEYVSYDERLEDIARRYGKDSERYKNAATIIESLESLELLCESAD